MAQSAEQGSFVTIAAGWKSEISVLGVVAVMNVTGVAVQTVLGVIGAVRVVAVVWWEGLMK